MLSVSSWSIGVIMLVADYWGQRVAQLKVELAAMCERWVGAERQVGELVDELDEAQRWAAWFAAERDWVANGVVQ